MFNLSIAIKFTETNENYYFISRYCIFIKILKSTEINANITLLSVNNQIYMKLKYTRLIFKHVNKLYVKV